MKENKKAMTMPMDMKASTYIYALGRPGTISFTPGSLTRAVMIYTAATFPMRARI